MKDTQGIFTPFKKNFHRQIQFRFQIKITFGNFFVFLCILWTVSCDDCLVAAPCFGQSIVILCDHLNLTTIPISLLKVWGGQYQESLPFIL
jgi:hypothetical protein